jgi:hypothetical protein
MEIILKGIKYEKSIRSDRERGRRSEKGNSAANYFSV